MEGKASLEGTRPARSAYCWTRERKFGRPATRIMLLALVELYRTEDVDGLDVHTTEAVQLEMRV